MATAKIEFTTASLIVKARIVVQFVCAVLPIWVSVISFASPLPQAAANKEQVKQSILNSVIFKTSGIFYPNERFGPDRKYSDMSAKEKEELKSQLERLLQSASSIYIANAERINRYLGDKLPPSLPPIVVKVVDEGSDKLGVEPFEDSSGKEMLLVEVDVKLLQTSFRAGVAAAFRGNETLNPLGGGGFFLEMDDPKLGANPTDDQLVARFLEFKKKVRTDFSKKMDDLQISARGMAVMTIDSRFTGSLLFGMAHEIGHYILKHSSTQDYPECTIFKEEELEADRFASYLLMRTLTAKGVFAAAFENDFTGFLNYGGSEVFFREGYERFGTKDKDTDEETTVCRHPPVEARLIATQSAMKAAIDASQEEENNTALGALEKRIQEIQTKNLKKKTQQP